MNSSEFTRKIGDFLLTEEYFVSLGFEKRLLED